MIIICIMAYSFFLFSLSASPGGVTQRYYPGDTPVLVLSPGTQPIGTVVVSHGFAANLGMLKPMGAYLASNGYRVVLFDLPGYGNSRLKMNETDMQTALDQVCAGYGGDDYSLAGHSLGSYAVLKYSMTGHGRAVIGLSSFFSDVNRTSPRNMLLIAGTGDMSTVVSSLPEAVANGTGVAGPEAGTLYGNFSNGTAREYEYVDANHITIQFNAAAYDEMIKWLDETYGHARTTGIYNGGPSLSLAFLAIVAALVAFLPALYLLSGLVKDGRQRMKPCTSRPFARPFLATLAGSLLAAVAVSLFNPAYYTGITMADKFIGFLLYAGIFIMAIDHIAGGRTGRGFSPSQVLKPLLVALAAGALLVAAIAIPMDMSFYEQPTVAGRLLLMAVVALLTLPFFIAGDSMVRRTEGLKSLAAGAGFRLIALALLAVSFAVSGNLFFDFVILPVILPLFLLLEIISYCACRWTGSIFAGAFLNALITGWLLASAFPIAIVH